MTVDHDDQGHDYDAVPLYDFEHDVVLDPHRQLFWDLNAELYEGLRPSLMTLNGMRIGGAARRLPARLRGKPSNEDERGFTSVVGMLAGIAWKHVGLMPDAALVQLYRDGRDYIAPHLDGALMTGPRAHDIIVPIFSFGGQRVLRFTNIRSRQIHDVPLSHGSMIVLRGRTQEYWLHELMATSIFGSAPRISVSFLYDQCDDEWKLPVGLFDNTLKQAIGVGMPPQILDLWARLQRQDPTNHFSIVVGRANPREVSSLDYAEEYFDQLGALPPCTCNHERDHGCTTCARHKERPCVLCRNEDPDPTVGDVR